MLEIYCDGSCRGNGKNNAVGGWAFCIIENDQLIFKSHGKELDTTNNRMELMAFIEAAFYAQQNSLNNITYYIDSAYIVNCFQQKWYINWQKNNWLNSKKQPVKNKDLWEILFALLENKNYNIIKVKGHMDNKWNNYVDNLAVEGALS